MTSLVGCAGEDLRPSCARLPDGKAARRRASRAGSIGFAAPASNRPNRRRRSRQRGRAGGSPAGIDPSANQQAIGDRSRGRPSPEPASDLNSAPPPAEALAESREPDRHAHMPQPELSRGARRTAAADMVPAAGGAGRRGPSRRGEADLAQADRPARHIGAPPPAASEATADPVADEAQFVEVWRWAAWKGPVVTGDRARTHAVAFPKPGAAELPIAGCRRCGGRDSGRRGGAGRSRVRGRARTTARPQAAPAASRTFRSKSARPKSARCESARCESARCESA